MNHLKVAILHLLLSLLLKSCFICNYKVKETFISSSCKFDDGFLIAKLKNVDSINNGGRPIRYEHDTIVFCSSIGDLYRSKEELEIFKKHNIPIIEYGFKFQPQKKIYFDRKNKYYEWWFWDPYRPSGSFDTIPIRFLKGEWYHLYKMASGDGTPNFEIFIHICENGNYRIIEYYNQGPF